MPEPDDFEARVLRFEQARQAGDFGPIAAYLGGPDPDRLLVELISLDLEFGWRHWPNREPTALAGYVAEFRALISPDHLPIAIIAEAYRSRQRWGDRPTRAAFLAQFATRIEPIAAELAQVDAEVAEEATEPRSDPSAPDPTSADGLLADRDFLLHRMIGAGRMGKVYDATPRGGGEPVAVKFLRRSLLGQPGAVGRFLAEAATIARLQHPGIVGTSGLGRTRGGSYFIVMERVPGPDLAEVGRRRPVKVAEAVGWMIETCAALEHAHEQGVIHCDLKPANLVLDGSGRVRVTDFGLARSLTAGSDPAAIEGTAAFMAPEQASPAWGPIGPGTDVYGVGAVLFTLLTGRPPLVGRRLPDILAQVVSATPIISAQDLRPNLPAALDDLCRRCLSKRPADRFAGVRAVRLALEARRWADD